MSINIQPVVLGFPLQTATTLTIILNSFEVSTATTSGIAYAYVGGSGSTNPGSATIGYATIPIPTNIFTAFTHNIGNSGVTTIENYVLSANNLTRLP